MHFSLLKTLKVLVSVPRMQQTREVDDFLPFFHFFPGVVEDVEGIIEMEASPLAFLLQFDSSSMHGPLLISDQHFGLSYCSKEGPEELDIGLFGVLEGNHDCKRHHSLCGTTPKK